MSPVTSRPSSTAADLWHVAERWGHDAQVLAERGGSHEAVYFASGFAAECALKAVALEHEKQANLPSRKQRRDYYSHDLRALVRLAGLHAAIKALADGGSEAAAAWSVALNWNIEKRYARDMHSDEARGMLRSVVDRDVGILQWLRTKSPKPG
jgi:HEPN domain-containing protein